jgi:hypothetical protein
MTSLFSVGGKIILQGGAAFAIPPSGVPNLLSRTLPVYTTTGTSSYTTASNYNNIWTSSGTADTIWIDVSTVSSADLASVALYWYDESGVDTTTLYFDVAHATGGGGVKNNQPATYNILGSTISGGGSPPSSGTTIAGVITNGYASNLIKFSLTGYNWVGFQILTSSSSAISIKCDLFDIHLGTRDIWFVGDSRTWFGTCHKNPHSGTVSAAAIADQMQPTAGFFAPFLNLGMSGAKAADMASLVPGWLTAMGAPHSVIFNIGINDATAGPWGSGWSTSFQSAVNSMISAGVSKVFCESIGYTTNSGVASELPTYNSAITTIVNATTGCYTGWDNYTFYLDNPSYISGDTIHPTDAGFAAQRTAQAAFYETLI